MLPESTVWLMCVQLNVTPPPVNNSVDVAKPPAKPLRSALRSSDSKVTHNDVPSKSEKNQSATQAADKTGRKVVDRKDTPLDLSVWTERSGGMTIDSSGSGGTTLADLKRQRAQSRGPPDSSPSQSSVAKSTTTSVGNGDVSSADGEPRLRLTSPELVAVEEKQDGRCCVII